MSNLPKETIDKIKADAKAYMRNEIKGMVDDEELQPHHLQYAHEAGATEWAGKGQPVIGICQEIVMLFDPTRRHVLIPTDMILRLSTALAKYKEVENDRETT